ncbi:phage tail protein [Enterobacter chengduensis]|uniref:phage tail protein n=1 Tax=Enterobacter chengduensis TaxID=2494701 RepID=UPI003D96DB70
MGEITVMAKNDFKSFATAANAHVMAQADWEALPALLSGFTAGKAASAEVNKAIRQASFIASALAQYTANKSGQDVLDDADLNGFITKMTTAFGKDFQALDATLTALAGLATGANKLPYFTGTDTVSQTDLTSVGRDIIGQTDLTSLISYLSLQAFVSSPSSVANAFSSVHSPDDSKYLVIANNGDWGAQDESGNGIPLPISRGGTGDATTAGARDNLGLSAGLPPIGIPFFWPSAAMPNTVMPEWSDMVFLKFNGATFSAATYPKLALVWPGLKLTESRGEFVRIWDDGRGVDGGRTLLSAQGDAQQAITGQFVDVTMGVNASASGAFEMTQLIPTGLTAGQASDFNQKNIYFDSSKVNRTAAENRPRNIAFNLLVRAK